MIESLGEGFWFVDARRPGPGLCLSFGVHGDERSPVEAGLELVARWERKELALERGRLLLVLANPRAVQENRRWSEAGVDLNRCFHASVLAREPVLYEERRARDIAAMLERVGAEVLVDFHCTVEPGRRFLMQHPPVEHAEHRRVTTFLAAETLLADPTLRFGGVSLDEWMSTRGKVGICYETGWLKDPANTPESVRAEMENVCVGLGLLDGRPVRTFGNKEALELDAVLLCDGEGFVWRSGIGENLQSLRAGTVLGSYADGRSVTLEQASVLVFPKKKPELVALGKPLVYFARSRRR